MSPETHDKGTRVASQLTVELLQNEVKNKQVLLKLAQW